MFNRILRYSSYQITELQIRWGGEDKSKIFFLVSQRNYMLCPLLELSLPEGSIAGSQ